MYFIVIYLEKVFKMISILLKFKKKNSVLLLISLAVDTFKK